MTKRTYECHALGDTAIVIQLGADIHISNLNRVRRLTEYFEQNRFEGLIEIVPAYTTITIYYDCFQIYADAQAWRNRKSGRNRGMDSLMPGRLVWLRVQHLLDSFDSEHRYADDKSQDVIEIPVCYGEEYGPDLAWVAAFHGVSTEEIVQLHASVIYPVHMIGFAPGFPYLGGMDTKLTTPRKSVPQTRIPAGSVGIGGAQTGIYPFETPGGWHVIGRTPLALFRPDLDPPSLLRVGDRVKFVSITPEQFVDEWERNKRDGF